MAQHDDTAVSHHAHTAIPIRGRTREEFSPLLYRPFAGYVAAFVTERLGRISVQTNRPGAT